MDLPFSQSDFLDNLGAYNRVFWPVAVALWVASLAAAIALVRLAKPPSRLLGGLLALHWAWSGLVYHAAYFTRINPAAWLFGALFLAQATLLVWYGVIHARLEFAMARSARQVTGFMLVAYALAYPFVVLLGEGLAWPRAPMFAVPCPTAIFTAGLLIMARAPLGLIVIPVLWSVIGGSAAFLLGVPADLVLLASGVLLVGFASARQLRPRRALT